MGDSKTSKSWYDEKERCGFLGVQKGTPRMSAWSAGAFRNVWQKWKAVSRHCLYPDFCAAEKRRTAARWTVPRSRQADVHQHGRLRRLRRLRGAVQLRVHRTCRGRKLGRTERRMTRPSCKQGNFSCVNASGPSFVTGWRGPLFSLKTYLHVKIPAFCRCRCCLRSRARITCDSTACGRDWCCDHRSAVLAQARAD